MNDVELIYYFSVCISLRDSLEGVHFVGVHVQLTILEWLGNILPVISSETK